MVKRPKHNAMRPWVLMLLMLGCAINPAQAQQPAPAPKPWPAGMQASWNDLLVLLQQHPWGAMEWTSGIYLGVRLMNFGAEGIPHMGREYGRATRSEEAFLSGAYLAVNGGKTERWYVRRELESNARKQAWLKALVGDGRALAASMKSGAEWQPAIRSLPSTGGCLLLAKECMQSEDILVRRAGLYWGFWLADNQYWQMAAKMSASDTDPTTRQFAKVLLRKRPQ